jgi:hypothetical protein
MVLISLVPAFTPLYLYVSTFRSMCAVFCSSLTSWFPGMLLTYFLNDFEIVPVAPIITGITFVFTFHMYYYSTFTLHMYYFYYYYYYYYYFLLGLVTDLCRNPSDAIRNTCVICQVCTSITYMYNVHAGGCHLVPSFVTWPAALIQMGSSSHFRYRAHFSFRHAPRNTSPIRLSRIIDHINEVSGQLGCIQRHRFTFMVATSDIFK